MVDLEPVVTDNYEVGLNATFEDTSFHVSYYISNSDLGSLLNKQDGSDVFTVEREKVKIKGLDVTVDQKFNEKLSAGLNYAWLKGESDTDDDGEVDSDLSGENIAPNRLNFFLDIGFGDDYTAFLQYSHLWSRSFEGLSYSNNDKDFGGYSLVDMYLSKDLGQGRLSLGVQNLLDKQYITYFSQVIAPNATRYFAGPGRTLNFNYNFSF